ncbi:NAD(+)--dinitrogen-reductase ADP-D-ribosyltransferase [uncultured Vibrio sp.]|uniref:NAD(+)--dinitrogen-reductase ADP-D-ribosyltransferase n=1 Tax=uncultured Vibrio sp. TaxID=114054 RepID=UPI0029C7CC6E|nr:NAD(+)--dinitrogen-reductase ADP-D-ribosyltransferase [uncultured Vibrio sp.]
MTELAMLQTTHYFCSPEENEVLNQICLPLNHCNVPSWLLASIAYQDNPIPLELDGIQIWYPKLFNNLKSIDSYETRAEHFKNFMTNLFHLAKHDYNAQENTDPPPRPKVNYRRLLLGWLFDSDNEQGAAWRSWVESRFGLLTCFHKESLHGPDTPEYLRFRKTCTRATYNTNELYAQLDLLYCFCQHELRLRFKGREHVTLYRGCAELPEHTIDGQAVKLFNNLSSFTADADSALRFGSKVYAVEVPLAKIACFESLLPDSLQGEQEFMVLGGLYKVERLKL